MSKIITLLFSLIAISAWSQDVKVFYEPVSDGYIMYASNNEVCAVSIELKLEMQNMSSENGAMKIYLVAGKVQKHRLTKISIVDPTQTYGMNYTYWTNLGDHLLTDYDSLYDYYLPFSASEKFTVTQSSNGSFSHQGIHAIDFSMPENTTVTAIRDGVVVKIVDSNKKGCGEEKCLKYNNYITIQHPDGTFSEYVHLKKKGALVSVGDQVKKGQHIAMSGNTGWSTNPHLHLEVYVQRVRKKETIKTKFLTGNGTKTQFLQEDKTYVREY